LRDPQGLRLQENDRVIATMIACDGPNRTLCSTAQNTNDIASYQGSIGTTQFGVFNLEQPIDNE